MRTKRTIAMVSMVLFCAQLTWGLPPNGGLAVGPTLGTLKVSPEGLIGRILNPTTGKGLADVPVQVVQRKKTILSVKTSPEGRFELAPLPRGDYSLRIGRGVRGKLTVRSSGVSDLTIRLWPEAVASTEPAVLTFQPALMTATAQQQIIFSAAAKSGTSLGKVLLVTGIGLGVAAAIAIPIAASNSGGSSHRPAS